MGNRAWVVGGGSWVVDLLQEIFSIAFASLSLCWCEPVLPPALERAARSEY